MNHARWFPTSSLKDTAALQDSRARGALHGSRVVLRMIESLLGLLGLEGEPFWDPKLVVLVVRGRMWMLVRGSSRV